MPPARCTSAAACATSTRRGVIHFAAHPPSKLWSMGVPGCSHAEWVGSYALAERKASRWRKEPCVEAIEILEAVQV